VISVVVPLYNYAHYIEANIRSVLSQTHTDWELVIVDDASKDDPARVIMPYVNNHANIHFYQLPKNKGYSHAKNYAIERTRGDYITTIDADDLLTPDSLKNRLAALEAHPRADWVHGRAMVFSDNPKNAKPEKMLYKRWRDVSAKGQRGMMYKSIHAQTVMVRRRFYENFGLYDEKMRFSADREMWLRAINQNSIPVYADGYICFYRTHKKQMHRSKYKAENLAKIQKYAKKISSIRANGINESNTRMLKHEDNRPK